MRSREQRLAVLLRPARNEPLLVEDVRRPDRECRRVRGTLSALAVRLLAARGADQRQHCPSDRFWQRRPCADNRGKFQIGSAAFACHLTTPGTTPDGGIRRKSLVLLRVAISNLGTVDPVVAGSSPVVLADRKLKAEQLLEALTKPGE
jgi:hypothetical protein